MATPRRRKLSDVYVVARGSKGRPSCQHKMSSDSRYTACGQDITRWSFQYVTTRLDKILCKRNACKRGA